jgi:hypothetical protein
MIKSQAVAVNFVMSDVTLVGAVHFKALTVCHWIQEAVHRAVTCCLRKPSCKSTRHHPTGKFRVNANGKLLDVWKPGDRQVVHAV